MSGDDSFDPKTWSSPTIATPPPSSPQSSRVTQLPDIFADVAKASGTVPPTGSIPTDVKPGGTGGTGRWLPYLASAALLVAGAAYARFDYHPPVQKPVAEEAADTSAPPPLPADESVSKRTLALAGIGDVRGALEAAGLPQTEVAQSVFILSKTLGAATGEIRATLSFRNTGGTAHLVRLDVSRPDGSGAVISAAPDGSISGRAVTAELSKQIRVVRGELDDDSFYTSAVTAGLTDTLIPEFVNAFSFDFNLAADVHPGDTFEVAYEQEINAAGEPVGQPQLLFASLTTAEKSRSLYRFKPSNGEVGWFDGNGGSTVRSFMRTPIDGARITSKFGMRFHPVLHYTRLHGGTDFAAPVGTPVYAAADGTVVNSSPSGCGGNWVFIDHKDGMQTRYFHLSRYADGLHPGEVVKQGFTIGYSGNTGTCTTGPHLHYEVHINGEKVDPMSVISDTSNRKPLDPADRPSFLKLRDQVDVARARTSA